ncbi:MAG: hypothetical protein HFE43_11260 [Oscillospiraceae bacterium]|nr:hypothetical protein [Oscillospiraceae bacterium]
MKQNRCSQFSVDSFISRDKLFAERILDFGNATLNPPSPLLPFIVSALLIFVNNEEKHQEKAKTAALPSRRSHKRDLRPGYTRLLDMA